jgi:mycofactocin biosynthesis protein MftB
MSATRALDLDAAWRLHPQVALRPEPFGAPLYHFGTRRLSFLKDRTVVSVITSLSDHPTARSALRALGVDGSATYPKALAVLAGSHMLVRTS